MKIKRGSSDSRCTSVRLYFLPLIAVVERDEYNTKNVREKGKKKRNEKKRKKEKTNKSQRRR